MDEWVWSNGGMILTGENWSAGRKTLYSVGGRWMNVYGAMVEVKDRNHWVTRKNPVQFSPCPHKYHMHRTGIEHVSPSARPAFNHPCDDMASFSQIMWRQSSLRSANLRNTGAFPVGKTGREHSANDVDSSRTEIKKEWSCTSTPLTYVYL